MDTRLEHEDGDHAFLSLPPTPSWPRFATLELNDIGRSTRESATARLDGRQERILGAMLNGQEKHHELGSAGKTKKEPGKRETNDSERRLVGSFMNCD